ncbi:MAG: hypothetical protein V4686_03320 [Patescibacteria group bacterium]
MQVSNEQNIDANKFQIPPYYGEMSANSNGQDLCGTKDVVHLFVATQGASANEML